mgnify:CR=1 FL=1
MSESRLPAALKRAAVSLRAIYEAHAPFFQLLVVFTVFRVMAVLLLIPGGHVDVEGSSNNWLYFQYGSLGAAERYPFLDYWVEYPPLFPWLAVATYKLSLLIPAWFDVRLWPNTLLRWAMVPFEVGSLTLVYRIVGRLFDRERAMGAAVMYALLFGPLFVLLIALDAMQVFFLLLAIDGLVAGSPVWAALGTGLGFGVKTFTVVVIPAAIRVFSPPMTPTPQTVRRSGGSGIKRLPPTEEAARWRGLAVYGGGVALCLAAIFVPFLIADPTYMLGFFKNLAARNSFQTVWAIWEGYYGVGSVAPLSIRYQYSSIDWIAPEYAGSHPLPWGWITLGFAALGLFLYTRRIDWGNPIRSTAFIGLTMGLLLLYSKGYSPPFNVYPIALAILVMPDTKGVLYGILFGVVMAFDWPLLVQLLPRLQLGLPLLAFVRAALTLALCVDFLAIALPESRPARSAARWALPIFLAGSVGVIGWQAIPAARAYATLRMEFEPLAPVIEAIQADESQPPVVVVQPSLLQRLQPSLPPGEVRYVPNVIGTAWTTPDEWFLAALAGHDRAWLIFDNREESRRALASEFRGWLDAHGCPISQTWVDTDWVGHYAIAPTPAPQPIEAEFEGGVRLVSATVPDAALHPGEALCVRLVWEADEPPPADYAAFVHVLSAEGVLVAQSDLWPDAPTSTWGPGQAITTGHGLWLPADLPPGEVALRAGLYTPGDGVRLPLVGGGDSADLGAMPIGNP